MWIYRRKGGDTAKKLAAILNCRVTRKTYPRIGTFVVNFGNVCGHANLNRNVNSNKLETHLKLKAADINMANIYQYGDEIPDSAFPLLARKKYHTQGKDIIYIHNREQLENSVDEFKYDYLIEYINKTSEYRVHVLRDYGVFVSVKFNRDGNGDPIVRSKKNGWEQIEYNGEFKEELITLANKVIDIVGYDFGAVDIIRKKDKLYVLEINSAPGLEPRKLQLYAEYFKEKERQWKANEY